MYLVLCLFAFTLHYTTVLNCVHAGRTWLELGSGGGAIAPNSDISNSVMRLCRGLG